MFWGPSPIEGTLKDMHKQQTNNKTQQTINHVHNSWEYFLSVISMGILPGKDLLHIKHQFFTHKQCWNCYLDHQEGIDCIYIMTEYYLLFKDVFKDIVAM